MNGCVGLVVIVCGRAIVHSSFRSCNKASNLAVAFVSFGLLSVVRIAFSSLLPFFSSRFPRSFVVVVGFFGLFICWLWCLVGRFVG